MGPRADLVGGSIDMNARRSFRPLSSDIWLFRIAELIRSRGACRGEVFRAVTQSSSVDCFKLNGSKYAEIEI